MLCSSSSSTHPRTMTSDKVVPPSWPRIEDVGACLAISILRPSQQSSDYEPYSMFKNKISLLDPILCFTWDRARRDME
ncbi:hypothetical protein NL676_005236 [Syzygium grande]|nr:hypothetical protein NL676_005236 [Syzygium grande]